MLVRPQATTDNIDITWIQKQVQCWIHNPLEQQSSIYSKATIKGIVPLSFNKGNSKVMCLLDNGAIVQTKAINLQKRCQSSTLYKDLISLDVINAAQILMLLRRRFQDKKIHTYMWNTLIIVNPFARIEGMYDDKVMRAFYEKSIMQRKGLHQLEPHIYGFTCNIVNNMRQSQKTQMISISGESGSGKTQTNKQCLRIISFICESSLKSSQKDIPNSIIQERILNCDCVLECFGNAKTEKNDNSSRFGKLITEKINIKHMQILHCEVKVFFLEKSRIVHQIQGERNFHIFYLLLNFCNDSLKSSLGLKMKSGSQMKPNDFFYLQKSSTTVREQERSMWNNLMDSFSLLGITQNQKKQIFQIVAAVLHLGNLKFDDTHLNDHDPCEIVNDGIIPLLSNLLQIQQKVLYEALLFNKKQLAGETMLLPMSLAQCVENRDSISKSLYQNVFLWVVEQLNKKVNENGHGGSASNVKIIKMLDIYGFQVFQYNSFQQLNVNYTNERIHQIYLQQVFKQQKNILKREGLESIIPSLKFTDNGKLIQLLDTSLKSIYNLLDQSCSLNVKDQDFLNSVKRSCEGHQHFPGTNNTVLKKCFIIKHTPGQIQYMVNGFRNKNKDFLREDVVEKLAASKSGVIGQKFSQMYENLKTQKNKKFLGFKIRKQVSSLISEMSSNSDMHFIRCIKPNQKKQPLTFNERVCYNQIKYLGILDTVRMRKDTYHVRLTYKDFYLKYGILNNSVQEIVRVQQSDGQGCKEEVSRFMDELRTKTKTEKIDFLLGIERIFMKMQTNQYLQSLLKQKTKKIAFASTMIKVIWRARYRMNQRKNFIVYVRKIQKSLKSYLKDITNIKKKNAVRVIQQQWIKRSQVYFRVKKRIPLMAVQKYVKKIAQKIILQKQYNSVLFAKEVLRSAIKTNVVANYFETHQMMKKEFKEKIYDMIWDKMKVKKVQELKKYFKGIAVCLENKGKIKLAEDKAYNRLILKKKQTISKYFHAFHWYREFEKLHNQIVKVQKFLRMISTHMNYKRLRNSVIFIQKQWRKFKSLRQFSRNYTRKYFHKVNGHQQWKNVLFRSLRGHNIIAYHEGVDKSIQNFEKIKKDKIILFYYLIDFQVFCENPCLDSWINNYLTLTDDSLQKLNPVQFIDISNTHTVATTTNRLYVWGHVPEKIEQYQLGSGKITKISAQDYYTRVDMLNPQSQQKIPISNPGFQPFQNMDKEQDNTNKEWSTLGLNFVLLNGIVLTMEGVSFSKLNVPEKVNQISCGMGHVIIKTILKKVFTWGKNNCGQLGTGDYFETNSMQARMVEFFYKRRIPVCQVSATPQSCIVMDTNSKLYWFGSNGTITKVCVPEQLSLSSKSYFLANHTKYSPVRIISKWSKTMSLVGVTIACHDGLLKNQIPLRKKVLEGLMMKWSEDINTISPPYSQSVADNISERHMPLPGVSNVSGTQRSLTNRQIKQKIISDIQKIQQAQRELLRNRKVDPRKNL